MSERSRLVIATLISALKLVRREAGLSYAQLQLVNSAVKIAEEELQEDTEELTS